jgi:hypothetical protein
LKADQQHQVRLQVQSHNGLQGQQDARHPIVSALFNAADRPPHESTEQRSGKDLNAYN